MLGTGFIRRGGRSLIFTILCFFFGQAKKKSRDYDRNKIATTGWMQDNFLSVDIVAP